MRLYSAADALCVDGALFRPNQFGVFEVPDGIGLRLINNRVARRATTDEVETLSFDPAPEPHVKHGQRL